MGEFDSEYLKENILFSFDLMDKNEFFNLDGTCQNWASDLFDTMKAVSNIPSGRVYSGEFSRGSSPLRIHMHGNAVAPCNIPENIDLEAMWQIRISASKGGIHGTLVKNIFHVVWFDPQHNLHPDKNHGGLKKIIPPSTCCKERDKEITVLREQLEKARSEVEFWEKFASDIEKEKKS